MEWIVHDNSEVRIVDSIVSDLKDWTQAQGVRCKVSLSLCDSFFWLTAEERRELMGPVGNYGCEGPRGEMGSAGCRGITSGDDTRPLADPKRVVVTIEFKLPSVHAHKLKDHKLVLTPNHLGEHLPTWQITSSYSRLPYCCGVYKRPGFDAAFNAMKALKSHLTETDFARDEHHSNSGWDEDLVSLELFHGWDNCLKTFTAFEQIETGESIVRMSLLAVDVSTNLSYITTQLSPFTCEYISHVPAH